MSPGCSGDEVEGGEKFCGSGGGIGRGGKLVETGKGAEGAGFECWSRVGEGSYGEEVGAGFGVAIGTGQHESEGDMRWGKERVGVDGLAITGLGGGGVGIGCGWGTDGFESHAEVVEDLGIVGDFGVEFGEEFEGGWIVSCGQGGVGFLDERRARGGFSVGLGEVLRREGEGERNDQQDCGESGKNGPGGFVRVGRGACDKESPSWLTKITRLTEKPGAGVHRRRWG